MDSHWSSNIGFYADCYKADSREFSITNLLKISSKQRFFLSGQEALFTGTYPQIALPIDVASVLVKDKEQYYREKQLIYGAVFVVGRMAEPSSLAKPQKVCAPLVYSYADIHEDGGHYFLTLTSPLELNYSLLDALVSSDSESPADIENVISSQFGTFDRLALKLEKYLTANSAVKNTISLLQYPDLANKDDVLLLSKHRALHASPSAVLALVDKPKSSQGVDECLSQMIRTDEISPPCKALFSNVYTADDTLDIRRASHPEWLPLVLSSAQCKALNIAANETLGLISGPPGTGKSFTIASCVVDRVLDGEKVLVVSETENALEVVADKLSSHFSIRDGVVRAGKNKYLSELKTYLEDLLTLGVDAVELEQVQALRDALTQLASDIKSLESQYEDRSQRSIKRGRRLTEHEVNPSMLTRFFASLSEYQIRSDSRHWELLEAIHQLEIKKEALSKNYIRTLKAYQLHQLLKENRSELVRLNKAIRARTSLKQKTLFDSLDYRILLRAFPIWLVSLSSLHKVLPAERALFDLVIFDESSQCNIATSIPALQRASRALIVGDAKQLRHVSFLSKSKEAQLAALHKLSLDDTPSYRSTSIHDLAVNALAGQSATALLDEHFRSQPDIIAFSNQAFYRNKLKVMTQRPSNRTASLQFVAVNGKRNSKGENFEEADQLLAHIQQYMHGVEAEKTPASIGILSPFRAQVDYLRSLATDKLGSAFMQRHNVLIGTPYHFQGAERDRMYLSFALCPSSLKGASYLNNENVFNVTVTRAKSFQAVYLSIEAEALRADNLLRKYICFSGNTKASGIASAKDLFQNDVCAELVSRGVNVWKNYSIASYSIDILCEVGGRYLGVDLIGYPGACEGAYSLTAYKVLRRAGLDVVPLSYGVWREFKSESLSTILTSLNNLD